MNETLNFLPIIFSLNPKSSVNFFYFFLDSLQVSITEENKNAFTFLSEIFSDIASPILHFYFQHSPDKFPAIMVLTYLHNDLSPHSCKIVED